MQHIAAQWKHRCVDCSVEVQLMPVEHTQELERATSYAVVCCLLFMFLEEWGPFNYCDV
jgi:hypothetical protein